MKVEVKVPPAQEPISLERIKNHARQMSDIHDDLLNDLIFASRSMAEQMLGLAIMEQQLTQYRNRFDRVMRLPRPPLVSVESIEYLDRNEQLQVVDSNLYFVDVFSFPGQITLNLNYTWPEILSRPNSVMIHYTAGYGQGREDVPESLKQGLITLAVNQYYNPGMIHEGHINQLFHAYFAEHQNLLVDEV